ncbi:hypothetical protein H6G33_03165 [Calothrix sp. FACHB-1219]|nr:MULTISPECIES: hypothetical protein [unclassified Calothrix]MBD2216033.1 hypothetical protein [Calothrix sp. FACHB-1219]
MNCKTQKVALECKRSPTSKLIREMWHLIKHDGGIKNRYHLQSNANHQAIWQN